MAARTNFRRKLLWLAIAPLAIGQLVLLFAVMQTVQEDVDRRARNSLQIGAEVVKQYLSSRSDQLNTSVQVLAADFGLKEAAVTGDGDTMRSVLRNHSLRVGAGVAMLLDLDGQVVASTDDFTHQWQSEFAWVTVADTNEPPRQVIATAGSFIYQVFVVPLRAPITVGWIVMGFRIDQAMVQRIAGLTGLGVALVGGEGRDAVVLSGDLQALDSVTASRLARLPAHVDTVYTTDLGGLDYLALGMRVLPDNKAVQLVLMRSLQDAMAPYVHARNGLIIFVVILLSLVAMAAAWVSGGIARPLRMLTHAARRMSSGQYDELVSVSSDDELGELAESFNMMGAAIAERERHIFHHSMHDALTDLPNRAKLTRQLSTALEDVEGDSLAVLSIRLLRINEISTTLGHSASDELIRLSARQLQLDLKERDLLGHLGYDDFAIVLPGADLDYAMVKAEKIQTSLGTGVMLGSVTIALQTEIGIANYPGHAQDASGLLRSAMIARSEARLGSGSIAVYEPGREQYYLRQLRIVNELRSAIQKDELHLCYQPKVKLATGAVCGVEALVRWTHPEYGKLSPDEFVPAAEEAGTIQHLTRFVLGKAIEDCRKWQDAGHELQVSVNISACDLLDEYLPYFVSQLLKEHQLPAHRLTLEVTESTVMRKLEKAIFVLECLRDIGVRIAMDDFGTGQSSLVQLKNIPLQELKIDKSFIMTLCADTRNQAIVSTTLQLAKNMSLEVVAEGVEDSQTMDYLAAAGCQQAQGYYISKPITSDELVRFLAGRDAGPGKERRGPNRPFTPPSIKPPSTKRKRVTGT